MIKLNLYFFGDQVLSAKIESANFFSANFFSANFFSAKFVFGENGLNLLYSSKTSIEWSIFYEICLRGKRLMP